MGNDIAKNLEDMRSGVKQLMQESLEDAIEIAGAAGNTKWTDITTLATEMFRTRSAYFTAAIVGQALTED